jgi:hypothetical protein
VPKVRQYRDRRYRPYRRRHALNVNQHLPVVGNGEALARRSALPCPPCHPATVTVTNAFYATRWCYHLSILDPRPALATERVERRLTAILAADVAGYSRLMGADEEGTHAQLQDHLRSLVDPKIAEHRGRVVKNTGEPRCLRLLFAGYGDREPGNQRHQ